MTQEAKYANLVNELKEVYRLLASSTTLIESIPEKMSEGLKINNEGYEKNTLKKSIQNNKQIENNLYNIINQLKTKM